MYDMVNIFEVFLPQLLRYPNPTDPLNGEAAALMMRDEGSYNTKVKGRLNINKPVGLSGTRTSMTEESTEKYE